MQFSPGRRWLGRLLTLLSVSLASSLPVYAQRTESAQTIRAKATLHATVTTQGTIPLGGVVVSVVRAGTEAASGVTDAEGKVSFDLDPGTYSLLVTSQGFDTLKTNAIGCRKCGHCNCSRSPYLDDHRHCGRRGAHNARAEHRHA